MAGPGGAPDEAAWLAATGALLGAGEVLLTCHLGPDGDALGSMLAVAHALRAAGRPAVASFSNPLTLPGTLAGLPGFDPGLLTPPERAPVAPDLLVTFDTGSADRLGDLTGRIGTAGAVLVVDHHVTNTRYGTLHLVDPAAPATAVLVAELLDRLGLPLTPEAATCLYVGLITDTGSFRYAGTGPDTLRLAARLLETMAAAGIRHDLICQRIYDTQPFGYHRMLAGVLARAVLEPSAAGGRGLVWTWTTGAELAAHGLRYEHCEPVIDVLRTAVEAEVAVVCKELPDGRWAVSTRGKGAIDMGAVCAGLGGGGHRFAAGFTTAEPPATAVGRIRKALAALADQPSR
ncbi:MAG: DHH family phosphoesterase [Mycobacteriales bacterium]